MIYFVYDEEYDVLTPNAATYYHIDCQLLGHYKPDGEHHWFPHMAKKNWFTEDMFWELLEFSKKRFPEVNFDKAIYQVAQIYKMHYVYENLEWIYKLHKKLDK